MASCHSYLESSTPTEMFGFKCDVWVLRVRATGQAVALQHHNKHFNPNLPAIHKDLFMLSLEKTRLVA